MSVAGSHRCGAQVRVAKRTTNGRRGGRACVHGSCRAFASGAGVLRRGGSPGQRCAGGACHDSKSSRRMRSACTSERWCRPADCELHRARAPQRSGSGTRADCGVSLSSHTRADHPPNLKRIATRARLVACKNHATDGRVKALCVCFKAPRTYTPALSALVSPLEGHSPVLSRGFYWHPAVGLGCQTPHLTPLCGNKGLGRFFRAAITRRCVVGGGLCSDSSECL